MPFSTRGGVRVWYETHGSGPPLVLVHANPFDHRLWMYQIASFAERYRVLAIDLRGYGRSDRVETRFTLRDMADDIVGMCEQEGVTRAIFAGVSVGSGIAMLIGLDQPELVGALVLVGGGSTGAPNLDEQLAGWAGPDFPAFYRSSLVTLFAPGFTETRTGRWVYDLFCDTIPSLSGRAIAEIYRARCTLDMADRLPGMKPPTLVVNGEHDVSLQGGYATARLIPNAQHTVLPGTGHACNIEDPAGFDAAVLQFLSEHVPPTDTSGERR